MQPTKLPLIVVPTNRDATLDTDSKLINGFVEKAADGQIWVCKRPGFKVKKQVGLNGAVGLGVYNWLNGIASIWGIEQTATGAYLVINYPGSSTNHVFYGLDNLYGDMYSFTTSPSIDPIQNQAFSKVFFHNGISAYVFTMVPVSFTGDAIAGSNVISNISIDTNKLQLGMFIDDDVGGSVIVKGSYITKIIDSTSVEISQNALDSMTTGNISFNGLQKVHGYYSGSFLGDTISGSPGITNISPDTGNVPLTSALSGDGIVTGSEVVSIDSHTSLTMSASATASATGVTINYDKYNWRQSVPGAAYVDGTTYAMTEAGFINGSELGDPTVWGADNYILAQTEPDAGVYLARQNAFIVAFKQYSTEVFYDAGNPPPGSPLSPVQGAAFTVGCKHWSSVSFIEGNIFWIGQNRSGSVSAYQMTNLKHKQISSPSIDKILQEADYSGEVYSFGLQFNGHKFYVVTIVNTNITLAYDLTTETWAQWTDTYGNYIPFVDSTFTEGNEAYLQHMNDGILYEIDPTLTSDWNGNITFDLITPNFDAGTRFRKYLKCIDFIGDQVSGSTMFVRSSNDDYQTWSDWRILDLGKVRPFFMNCGTFRRRAYWFRHDGDNPMRLQSVELQLDLGTL